MPSKVKIVKVIYEMPVKACYWDEKEKCWVIKSKLLKVNKWYKLPFAVDMVIRVTEEKEIVLGEIEGESEKKGR